MDCVMRPSWIPSGTSHLSAAKSEVKDQLPELKKFKCLQPRRLGEWARAEAGSEKGVRARGATRMRKIGL